MKPVFKITKWAIALGMASCALALHAAPWGYEGDVAPEKWGDLAPEYSTCGLGKYQTPVDIKGAVHAPQLPALQTEYKPSAGEVLNNGHTIQFNFKNADNYLTLDGTRYTLKQFHFHAPSENHIDGKSFPMEVHLVHMSDKGDLAVIGVMFDTGAANSVVDSLLAKVSPEIDKPTAMEQPINAQALLPKKTTYYRFPGSLTTPPCSEGVTWLVLKQPMSTSKEQTEQMQTALRHHNNRPLQPLNGRVIVESN